ncbi:MAG: tripartite tricarboxylate transporter substrate binding protein [Rhodoferax sp.]|uniref:Bug family tripartite tricarboxylate transporter substrate binding protein n=1 Tax=Rhodoferax sp. TaxID=50421 RepID=UPI002ACDC95B|nr:tripartite tricarboxylate transporter substrate binding protein [Rhodoferax sp.]MDZ7893182.1 tripartite tricarboxylate transporter substrate binding protein [Rhodoferax sp.]
MDRRTLVKRTLITVAGSLTAGLAGVSTHAQGLWPAGKAITYVVPFPPGGNTDTIARLIAQPLSNALGTPLVIDNKGGAGGSVGSAIALRAPADGYTLLGGTISSHSINGSLYTSPIGYDMVKSFAPVAMLGVSPLLLVVPASSPIRTLDDLLKASRAKSGGLSSGSPGIGTSPHMALELLSHQSGVKFTHAPYKGSAPAVQDLVSGQLDMMFDTSLVVGPHIQSGRLRAIAITGSQRVPGYSNVPTIAESGQKGFDMVSWQAMFVPANTPQAVIDRLHAEVMKVLSQPDVQAKLKGFGMEPSSMTPAQLLEYQKAEVDKWNRVIKAANIKAE